MFIVGYVLFVIGMVVMNFEVFFFGLVFNFVEYVFGIGFVGVIFFVVVYLCWKNVINGGDVL